MCVLINSEIYRWKTERNRGIMGVFVCICSAFHTMLPSLLLWFWCCCCCCFLCGNIAKTTLMTFHAIFYQAELKCKGNFSSCAISTDCLPVFFFRFIVSRSVGLFVSMLFPLQFDRLICVFHCYLIFCMCVDSYDALAIRSCG